MDKVNIVQLKQGDILFSQDDEDRILYKVLSGKITLYTNYGQSQEKELAVMTKDDCFGEMAILEDKPRSATAVATTDCSLMSYPKELMGYFITQNPQFALKIMQSFSTRLRKANEEITRMQELLLQAERYMPTDKAIQEYIQQHTLYDENGKANFVVQV